MQDLSTLLVLLNKNTYLVENFNSSKKFTLRDLETYNEEKIEFLLQFIELEDILKSKNEDNKLVALKIIRSMVLYLNKTMESNNTNLKKELRVAEEDDIRLTSATEMLDLGKQLLKI